MMFSSPLTPSSPIAVQVLYLAVNATITSSSAVTDGVGAAVRFNVGDVFQVTGTYLASGGTNGASNPNPGSGLFNGSYSAGAQVGFSFIKFADINFVYVRSYQTADQYRVLVYSVTSTAL